LFLVLLDIFEDGAIYAFKSGHKVEYNGQRSADTVVEFVLKVTVLKYFNLA